MNKMSTLICRTVQYSLVQFSHLVITESSRSRFICCLVDDLGFSRYGVVSVVTGVCHACIFENRSDNGNQTIMHLMTHLPVRASHNVSLEGFIRARGEFTHRAVGAN